MIHAAYAIHYIAVSDQPARRKQPINGTNAFLFITRRACLSLSVTGADIQHAAAAWTSARAPLPFPPLPSGELYPHSAPPHTFPPRCCSFSNRISSERPRSRFALASVHHPRSRSPFTREEANRDPPSIFSWTRRIADASTTNASPSPVLRGSRSKLLRSTTVRRFLHLEKRLMGQLSCFVTR